MAEATPDLLGEAVGPILEQLDTHEQRVLLAMLERQAAATYRRLAGEAPDPGARQALTDAGENEDGIADILEGLDSDHARTARDLHARFPRLDGLFDTVLGGRTYEQQLRLQETAERGAAVLFAALAEAEPDPDARQKLLDCGGTEQANADALAAQLA